MEQTNVNEKCFTANAFSDSGNAETSFMPEKEAGAQALPEVAGEGEVWKNNATLRTTPAQGVRISKIRNLEDDIDLQHLDALFKEASQYAKRKKGVTTAELQGEFALGYIRASRLLEQLKSAGVVNSKENSWNIVSQ